MAAPDFWLLHVFHTVFLPSPREMAQSLIFGHRLVLLNLSLLSQVVGFFLGFCVETKSGSSKADSCQTAIVLEPLSPPCNSRLFCGYFHSPSFFLQSFQFFPAKPHPAKFTV